MSSNIFYFWKEFGCILLKNLQMYQCIPATKLNMSWSDLSCHRWKKKVCPFFRIIFIFWDSLLSFQPDFQPWGLHLGGEHQEEPGDGFQEAQERPKVQKIFFGKTVCVLNLIIVANCGRATRRRRRRERTGKSLTPSQKRRRRGRSTRSNTTPISQRE